MANEGGSNEIGAMSFGLKADVQKLQADLKKGEEAVQASGQKMAAEAEKAGAKIGAGLGGGGGKGGGDGRVSARAAQASAAAELLRLEREAAGNLQDRSGGFTGLVTRLREVRSAAIRTVQAFIGWGVVTGVIGGIVSALYGLERSIYRAREEAKRFKDDLAANLKSPAEGFEAVQQDIFNKYNRLREEQRAKDLSSHALHLRMIAIMDTEAEELRLAKERYYANERIKQDEKEREALRQKEERDRRGLEDLAEELRGLEEDAYERRRAFAEEERRRFEEWQRQQKEAADAIREVARQLQGIDQRITDALRQSIRDLAQDIRPDIRAIGPKLDAMRSAMPRYNGKG